MSTLPTFASTDDLEARGVDVTDVDRAWAALDDASTLIRVEARKSWVADDAVDFGDLADYLQDAIVTVCITAARRALENPTGASAMAVGDVSVTLADASSDVYLTNRERIIIRTAAGQGSALGSIELEVGTPGYSGYIDVGQTEPMPFTYEPLRP